MYDPLAQLAEHLTFNQGVWSSNLQWVIPICLPKRVVCGRGGMADAPDLGSGVSGRMSSSLIVRTVSFAPQRYVEHAVVAQLVERHLAKVEVAGPSPVYRSTCGCSSMAELQPSKLATRVRFPSPAPEERQIASKRRPVGWRFRYAQMAVAATVLEERCLRTALLPPSPGRFAPGRRICKENSCLRREKTRPAVQLRCFSLQSERLWPRPHRRVIGGTGMPSGESPQAP